MRVARRFVVLVKLRSYFHSGGPTLAECCEEPNTAVLASVTAEIVSSSVVAVVPVRENVMVWTVAVS